MLYQRASWIVLLVLLLIGYTVSAQVALEGRVVDATGQPLEARVLLQDRQPSRTNPDGTFSVSVADLSEIQQIRAEKEGYHFDRYELSRTKSQITLHMTLETREVWGRVRNVRDRAVQGARISVPEDPRIATVYSNPQGKFRLEVPLALALNDLKGRFRVDETDIPPENITFHKGDKITLVVPDNTAENPVFQVRVHDARTEDRLPDVILTVGGRVYQADEEGVIQITPDHNLSKEVHIESSQWQIAERQYDALVDVLNIQITEKEEKAKNRAASDSMKGQPVTDESDTTAVERYKLTLDDITRSLEKEEVSLSQQRVTLINQIEDLTQQLSNAPQITDQQRIELSERLFRLEKVLEAVDSSYERNRRRTDSLMQMMRSLILEQKRELEKTSTERDAVKSELFNTLEEKAAAEKAYNRRLRFAITVGGVIALAAIVIYFFLTRMRRQKNELEKLHHSLSENNRKITDNLRYAKDIQDTILPAESEMQAALGRYFLIFRPRDLVSGDFYWLSRKPEQTFVAVVDCTGHGVSGAFMSMIGYTVLNEVINQKELTEPAKILEELHRRVRIALKQDQEANDDGMDICLCRLEDLDNEQVELTFAGAKRSLYVLRRGAIETVRGNSRSVGGRQRQRTSFTQQTKRLRRGDRIYLTSDGMADQNNTKRKKLGTRNLLHLITESSEQNLHEQGQLLRTTLNQHQGQASQRDDITVLGIEL